MPGNITSAISLRVWASLPAWFWLTPKMMDFPISSLMGVAQGVFQERLAEDLVCGLGKEAFLKFPLLESLVMLIAGIVGHGNDKTLVGKQLRCNVGAGVHHDRIDQVAVSHAVEQRVPERGLPALAAEGAVGVQQQPAFRLAGVIDGGGRSC